MISRYFLYGVLFLGSTSADRQLSKSDTDFWQWLQQAPKQDSCLAPSLGCCPCNGHPCCEKPSKMVLCFRLDLKWLWPGQSIEQQASSLFLDFYLNGIFCHCLCLFCFARDGVTGGAIWLVFAACLASAASVMHSARVTTAVIFCCCLRAPFMHVLLLIPCLSREIWGMNFPKLPEISHLECLLVHGGVCCTCVMVI